MTAILEYIVRHCSFLWKDGWFRIIEGHQVRSFGNALLVASSDTLRIRFVRDRSQLFLDFQRAHPGEKTKWYSIDVVRRLVTGERQDSAELDEDYAEFLQENLSEIELRFSSDDRWPDTSKRLDDLERLREKEMFG